MDYLQAPVSWILIHKVEIGLAIIFAVVVAMIFELLNIGSRLRSRVRYLRNRWSESSRARLLARIKELKQYRESIGAYLTSDKALYLATFRILIIMLMFGALGATAWISSQIAPIGSPFKMLSIVCFAAAVGAGFVGVRYSKLDTREKVSEMVEKIDGEIADLTKKLGVAEYGFTEELVVGSRVHILETELDKPRNEWPCSGEIYVIRSLDKTNNKATATPVLSPPTGPTKQVTGDLTGALSPFRKSNAPG